MAQPDLWLVRHGATDWSTAGKHTGRTDVALNTAGEAAARNLHDRLAGQTFDLVLTSPLQRARRTCELAGYGTIAQVDDNLCEWDYGDFEGVTTAEIRRSRPDWSVFVDGVPNGESLDEVGARADRVITRAREVEQRALVFGHGHALRVLAARWIELPPVAGAHFVLATSTISVLGWERETPAIDRWNARS